MDKIAILLVLYKDIENLKRLLESILIQDMPYEIFAIDCDVDQKSINYLKAGDIKGHYYEYQGNLGYAAGNNFLAQEACNLGFEYLLICNTDVILGNHLFINLYNGFRENEYVISSPLIYSGTPENTIGLHSYAEKMDFNKMKVITIYDTNTNVLNLPDSMETDVITGCIFMIKAHFISKNGLFFTEGFMYGEETDLACRMRKYGCKAICVKKAIAWHNHDWTSKDIYSVSKSYYYMNRNFILLCKRYYKSCIMIKSVIKEMLLLPCIFIWALRKYNVRFFIYYYKGIIDGIMNVKGENIKI